MSLHELDRAHLIHPEVQFEAFLRRGPTVIVSGEGSTVRDSEGRLYLDAQAGLNLVNIGYGRRRIARAAARQMERLHYYHTYWHFSNEPAIRLAARLASLLPPGLSKLFFTLGGAEAVETACKLARLYQRARGRPDGDLIICLDQGYHGSTFGALAATGLAKHKLHAGPLAGGFAHIESPDSARGRWGRKDPEAGERYAALLEERILAEGVERVAGFLAEPILGVGGVIVPPAGYWQAVRRICDRYGVLLLADEVMTGFGRTGSLFALEQEQVVPDAVAMAKGLTSGYMPLGACAAREQVIDAIAASGLPFTHGFTYAGHPVACAVALEAIAILEEEGLAARSGALGERLLRRLRAAENPHFGDVRGRGLMVGIDLVRDRQSGEPFQPEARIAFRVEEECFRQGVIIGAAPYRDALILTPPLVITDPELERLAETVDRAVRRCAGVVTA
jgi:putrescine---pyruvate transaminase